MRIEKSICSIFYQNEYETASLAVPQPSILKHSTDPNHPFVCFEEESQNSNAARLLIETSELKQIIPPKPLDDIVPTTLVSTCDIVSTSKVLNKGLSNMMTRNCSAKEYYKRQQNCVQELHTIYGSTSHKLYKVA